MSLEIQRCPTCAGSSTVNGIDIFAEYFIEVYVQEEVLDLSKFFEKLTVSRTKLVKKFMLDSNILQTIDVKIGSNLIRAADTFYNLCWVPALFDFYNVLEIS